MKRTAGALILFAFLISVFAPIYPEGYADGEAEIPVVTLGTYEQDNNYLNGPEPIEWIVLDRKDGSLLLISRYALDCKPYNYTAGKIGWADCTLRLWLNDTFYKSAFSEEDRQRIVESDVNAGSVGIVKDHVYLLSADDAYRYWDLIRDFSLTEFARSVSEARGEAVYDDGEEYWWLRTHGVGAGEFKDRKACAWTNAVQPYGHAVEHTNGGVRPVIQIRTEG